MTYTTAFKILNRYHPLWFKTFSTVHDKTSGMNRQQNCLYVPKANTDTGARSLEILGPNMWNSLPKEVVSAVNVNLFRSKLKAYLLGS